MHRKLKTIEISRYKAPLINQSKFERRLGDVSQRGLWIVFLSEQEKAPHTCLGRSDLGGRL